MTRLPFPPVGGDKVKSYHLVKILNSISHLKIVVVSDEKPEKSQIDFLKSNCINFKIFYYNKLRCILNLSKVFFNKDLPLQVAYYDFKDVHKYLNKSIQEQDILISTLIRSANYIIPFKNFKILDIVDSIYINYTRSIQNVNSLFWKSIYRFEINRLKKFETLSIKSFDYTIFVNQFEATQWSKYGKCRWIPNGVSQEIINYRNSDPKINSNYVCFFGKMNYQPNIDAVVWFYNNVLNLLPQDINLCIVGSNHSKLEHFFRDKTDRIYFTGYLDDPYSVIDNAICVIAPMRTGGGIQNKVLESMGLGQIVIASTLAANPIIGAKNGVHLIITDDPLEIRDKIVSIVQNRKYFQSICSNAKELIRKQFSWELYKAKISEIINQNDYSSLGISNTIDFKISIITVCLNSASTISDCIKSITSQSYENIELLIIDGGSTDGTIEIIEKSSNPRIKLISEIDLGIYDAINKGISLSSGDIIGILNSDDMFWDDRIIEVIAKSFSQSKTIDAIYGDLVYVDVNDVNKITRYWKAGIFKENKLYFGWMPPHPTFYMRREALRKVGYYRNDLGTAADYEFILRSLLKYKLIISYIPKILVKMRRGGASNGSFQKRIAANINDKKAWKINGLKPNFFFSILKPIRKIEQYFFKSLR